MAFGSEGSTRCGNERGEPTIYVQFVDLGLDRHRVLRLSRSELALDGLDQARTDWVELNGKVLSVHFPGLAVCLIIYILRSMAESGGLTCCSELVQLFRSRGREIDESWGSKLMMWSRGTRRHLLRVAVPIVKVETFGRRSDSSTTERRTVERESCPQSLQLGFSHHDGLSVDPLGGQTIYPVYQHASQPAK